jgi:regulator of sigma E protease
MLVLLQNILFTLLPWLVVLTVVVVVHELGHFLMARAFGVAVDRFSIGFGKTLLSHRDKNGTEWRIAALPLGGYVKFSGDADGSSSVLDAEDLDDLRRQIVARQGAEAVGRYFHFKPLWQRALVVLAGPMANFVLAIVISTVFLMTVGELYETPVVSKVEPDSPAAHAGFQPGDVVTRVAGRPVDNFVTLGQYVQYHANRPINFVVLRAGRAISLTATPLLAVRPDPVFGRPIRLGQIGVRHAAGADQVSMRRLGPVPALVSGTAKVYDTIDITLRYLGHMIQGRESGDQLGGPIRIALTTKAIAQDGAAVGHTFAQHSLGLAINLFGLIGGISISIGFMNLLPIPMLDGGHLVFYAYEAVARRPVTARVQAVSYRVGLALVVGLMLFATWNDLQLPVLKILGGHVS